MCDLNYTFNICLSQSNSASQWQQLFFFKFELMKYLASRKTGFHAFIFAANVILMATVQLWKQIVPLYQTRALLSSLLRTTQPPSPTLLHFKTVGNTQYVTTFMYIKKTDGAEMTHRFQECVSGEENKMYRTTKRIPNAKLKGQWEEVALRAPPAAKYANSLLYTFMTCVAVVRMEQPILLDTQFLSWRDCRYFDHFQSWYSRFSFMHLCCCSWDVYSWSRQIIQCLFARFRCFMNVYWQCLRSVKS